MKYFNFLSCLITACLFFSCEKVIDIDLNEEDHRIVIEAELLEGNNFFEVIISESKPYFAEGATTLVTNATVILEGDNGLGIQVPHITNGKYGIQIDAQEGVNYTLNVTHAGESYTASSKMQSKVNLTSLNSQYQEAFGPLEAGFFVYYSFQDPIAEGDFYRITHSLNGTPQTQGSDFIVENDRLTNGNHVNLNLAGKSFIVGDSVEVVLMHINKNSYNYFSSLQDIIGGGGGLGGAAAPGNPNSNWNNNALGYFSAQNCDTLSISIQ